MVRFSSWLTDRAAWLAHAGALAVTVLAVMLLVSARGQLSATHDENNHLVAGLEWWQYGTYTAWTENPPLARVAAAALPYAAGLRLPDRRRWDLRSNHVLAPWLTGADLLQTGDGYEANLRRLRQATPGFFLLALAAAWLLAGGRQRPVAGALAVALTATSPALLGHGALATTDVAFVGTFLLAVLAARRWAAGATYARAALLGAAAAAALLTKFSALVFLPLALAALLGCRRLAGLPAVAAPGDEHPARRRTLAAQLGLAAAVAALVVWAGYRFSVGAIDDLPHQCMGWFPILPAREERSALADTLLRLPLPAPELWHGLLFLRAHNQAGHTAYLLGEVNRSGFAAFYVVALLVKTPLFFSAPVAAVLAPVLRWPRARASWPVVALVGTAAAVVVASSLGRLNLGLRHVLVVVPLLAVAAAGAFAALWPRAGRRRRWLLGGGALLAVGGQLAVAVASHPNQLASFNALAGSEPAAVLLDSDLDWGQGLLQLRRELRARGVTELSLAYTGFTDPCRVGLPRLRSLAPGQPTTGWIAISENYYRGRSYLLLRRDPCDRGSVYRPEEIGPRPFAWLQAHRPLAIVAGSIRLYHLPE